MGIIRTYLSVIGEDGSYETEVEITDDMKEGGITTIKENIENNSFIVGVFKYSNVRFIVRNITGFFSPVGEVNSFFKVKRSDSKLRITWEPANKGVYCGGAICGESILSEDVDVYKGLLNDDASQSDVGNQELSLQVLGRNSILSNVDTPYSSITNGDLFSDVIKTCLNQSEITNVLTYDASKIVVGNDLAIDDKSELENTTVKEALDILLELSGSVLYIDDETIVVASRTPTADVKTTFRGQASLEGIEDIVKISKIRNGLDQTFNMFRWSEDKTKSTREASSIAFYGVRPKDVGNPMITDASKITSILSDYISNFGSPKLQFSVEVLMNPTNLGLKILDRVAVDYPNFYKARSGDTLPIYGSSVYGTDKYPLKAWAMTISKNKNFKILGKQLDFKKETITFDLKEI